MRYSGRTLLAGVAATVLAVAHSTAAFAQAAQLAESEAASSLNKVVYDEAYFAKYDVQNAEDMLRRIPGVGPIIAALGTLVQTRGFGSGGDQILINGRRVPGKSNEISKVLARINTRAVERVELIRGASKDIDVQSTGLVVNVVLRAGEKVAGGGNFELALRGNDSRIIGTDGLVNYTGNTGPLAYSLGIERNLTSLPGANDLRYSNRTRFESYSYVSGELQERRVQDWQRDHNKWIYTGGLTYDFPGGVRAQLNGLYQTLLIDEIDTTNFVQFARSGTETGRGQDVHVRVSGTVKLQEVSGELLAPLAGGRLALLFISNRRDAPTVDYRNRFSLTGTVSELSRSEAKARQGEDILRAQYGFDVTPKLNLELGGEFARNTLNQTLQPFFDLNRDGRVEPVALPFGAAKVKEIRGEGFINGKWSPAPGASVNASVNIEHSKLTTNSPFNPGRNLSFLKPRLDIRLNHGKSGQARFLAERRVSQLDFANFVPSYNVLNDRIDPGNPSLRPEQTWNFELGYQQRLGGDAGLIEGKLFYQSISDPIDFFPLRQGTATVSAQGNLGLGKLYGGEVKASVRLVPLGLRDAVVSLRGLVQDSSVRDPFSGVERRLRSDTQYAFDLGFRHDVRSLRLAYGFDYKNYGEPVPQNDLFSSDLYRIGPLLEGFAEHRLSKRLVVRAEVQNLLRGRQHRTRAIYSPDKLSGAMIRLDRSEERRDIRYALKLKGSF